MNNLVVIAEQEELKLVKNLGLDKYPVLITGVGALNVMNALKDIPRDTTIYNVGYAGSKDLEPGNFYCVDSVTLYHPNVDYKEPIYELGYLPFGMDWEVSSKKPMDPKVCYTGTDFVLSSDKNDCLFDMELAYIKALGFNVVFAFKYVSDNLDLQEYRKNLNEN